MYVCTCSSFTSLAGSVSQQAVGRPSRLQRSQYSLQKQQTNEMAKVVIKKYTGTVFNLLCVNTTIIKPSIRFSLFTRPRKQQQSKCNLLCVVQCFESFIHHPNGRHLVCLSRLLMSQRGHRVINADRQVRFCCYLVIVLFLFVFLSFQNSTHTHTEQTDRPTPYIHT